MTRSLHGFSVRDPTSNRDVGTTQGPDRLAPHHWDGQGPQPHFLGGIVDQVTQVTEPNPDFEQLALGADLSRTLVEAGRAFITEAVGRMSCPDGDCRDALREHLVSGLTEQFNTLFTEVFHQAHPDPSHYEVRLALVGLLEDSEYV